MKRIFAWTALVLASNYFTFQIELFDDEYEENHPQAPTAPAISSPTLTWESFDKDNAPQPIVVDAIITLCVTFTLPAENPFEEIPAPTLHRIRDKSPPLPVSGVAAVV
jgi:hypothetical protein